MLTYTNYVLADSLEQAYQLNQKRSAVIAGGYLWLKMQDRQIQTLVDLSSLGFDQIEESEEEFKIGCMVTLRQLEKHQGLFEYTKGALKQSVKHIVGTQFRNSATVGGSIFGRFGFSDVLTCFLAMDSYVELYQGGRIPMEVFAESEKNTDILTHLVIKKAPMNLAYTSFRNEAVDFPVLAEAVSVRDGKFYASVGARPSRAKVVSTPWKEGETPDFKEICGRFTYGSNMRATREYREYLAPVLMRRAFEKMTEGGER